MEKHVQVPRQIISSKFKVIDWYIYAHIRKYMNNETKLSFPTMETLQKDTKCTLKTIRKSIKNLVNEKEIEVIKSGRKYIFKFNPTKFFEMFTPDFLNQDLEPELIGYLMGLQSMSFKRDDGYAVMKKTQKEIAESLNLSTRTVRLYNTKLKEKSIILTSDDVTDLDVYNKNYTIIDLAKVCQAILFVKEEVDKVKNDVDEIKDNMKSMKDMMQSIIYENKMLKHELKELKQLQYQTKREYEF